VLSPTHLLKFSPSEVDFRGSNPWSGGGSSSGVTLTFPVACASTMVAPRRDSPPCQF
jgi:hypothetical protein